MGHDELALSLAAHLRTEDRMVWTDIQLGPSGSPRPDVYTLMKSFVRPESTAYEVKVSRSDFLADVTSGKWQVYLKYAGAAFFACEAGLVSPKELPERCGLMVLKDGRWRATKRATREPVNIPMVAWLKLVIDGVEREGPRARARHFAGDSDFYRKITAKHGELVAAAVKDRLAVEDETKYLLRQTENNKKDSDAARDRLHAEFKRDTTPLRAELCDILGLAADAEAWRIKASVKKLRHQMADNPAATMLNNISKILQNWKEEEKELAAEVNGHE